MSCKQSDIFDFSIKPTVDDILNGYNGTVFAYGQTGAGKSYTMCVYSESILSSFRMSRELQRLPRLP